LYFSQISIEDLLNGRPIPTLWQNIYLVGLYGGLIAVLSLFRRLRKEKWSDWGLSRIVWRQLPLALGAGLLLFLGFCMRASAQGLLSFPFLLAKDGPLFLIFLLPALALVGAEEVLFRGLLLNLFLDFKPLPALAFQALCFSAVHGASWQHFEVAFNLFLLGFFLGQTRLLTSHLGWAWGLHAGWVWGLLVLASQGGLKTQSGTWEPLQDLFFTFLLLVLCFAAYLKAPALWLRPSKALNSD